MSLDRFWTSLFWYMSTRIWAGQASTQKLELTNRCAWQEVAASRVIRAIHSERVAVITDGDQKLVGAQRRESCCKLRPSLTLGEPLWTRAHSARPPTASDFEISPADRSLAGLNQDRLELSTAAGRTPLPASPSRTKRSDVHDPAFPMRRVLRCERGFPGGFARARCEPAAI